MSLEAGVTIDGPVREVVVGRNSKVWQAVGTASKIAKRFQVAIGHHDISKFPFTSNDRVWIFSYSRVPKENSKILELIGLAGVREVVYVSSASTAVNQFTRCYEYPRVKEQAEEEARLRLNARILTLGIVYENLADLPSGINAATAQSLLEEFLVAPQWPDDQGMRKNLFVTTTKAFSSRWEQRLYALYGAVQWSVRKWPCILRPLDLFLRAIGFRWYGYVHLSNRLWTSTTS